MKGKKVDTEFVNDFISNCLLKNKTSSEEIVLAAKEQIDNIDLKIKEAEHLKKIRSKILDVIYTFEKQEKNTYNKILFLFKIQNPHIAKFLLDKIKLKKINIEDCKDSEYQYTDILFCIKQLLEYNVIKKDNDFFVASEAFNDYLSFVLKEF
jgi:hypothetical protein